jgi:hypothetical protein
MGDMGMIMVGVFTPFLFDKAPPDDDNDNDDD